MMSSVAPTEPVDPQDEVIKKRKLEVESFAKFLDSHIPSQLLPVKPSKYLVAQANRRLALAVAEHIDIKEIRIGGDYLPEWSGFAWDPEVEDLGFNIQTRLMDYEASKEVRFLRNELIALGNKRLEQAVDLGLATRDLFFGDDLLPCWRDGSPTSDDAEDYISASPSPEPFTTQTTEEISPDDTDGDEDTSSYSSCSCSSDSETDSIADVISLGNFVDPEPFYDEVDSCAYDSDRVYTGTEHIFHDAEVVGAPQGFADVDLEVYILDGDDSDLDDMPEMEMGVDRFDYELYHSTDEAVDIDLSGVEVRCSSDLPGLEEKLQHESIDVEMADQPRRHMVKVNMPDIDLSCPFLISSDNESFTEESEEE